MKEQQKPQQQRDQQKAFDKERRQGEGNRQANQGKPGESAQNSPRRPQEEEQSRTQKKV